MIQYVLQIELEMLEENKQTNKNAVLHSREVEGYYTGLRVGQR